MARTTADAPSMGFGLLQKPCGERLVDGTAWLENWLEAERDHIPLWIPVALGAGVAAWFVLPTRAGWIAFVLASLALALAGVAVGLGRRLGLALAGAGTLAALGCALVWWRADYVTAPVIVTPTVASFVAEVEEVQRLPARGIERLIVLPDAGARLPPRLRITVDAMAFDPAIGRGSRIMLRARIAPPPRAVLPGAYDYARAAWFQRIGGVGHALDPPRIVDYAAGAGPGAGPGRAGFRATLAAHIQSRIGGAEGGIATALAIGDQGAIPDDDAEAMRRSGLAHLLSVSGLHLTAVVVGTMFLVMRLLALSPAAALHLPLQGIAAAAAALAAIGYTLLTGAEIPTVRACIAALIILAAVALGREAITLRLVAAAALLVIILWPETLITPSFQLSFSAVTALIALHNHPRIQQLFARREEPIFNRIIRASAALLLTGLVVELALAPIAIFHFHKTGLYGALANIIAIPLTTFVIMPFEALALVLDPFGLSAPFWWLTKQALSFLLGLAHSVSNTPGAVAIFPTISRTAFAAMVTGGLWICLWQGRARYWGLVPFAVGFLLGITTPKPDILITSDGRHLAYRDSSKNYAILRPAAGAYIREILADSAGQVSELRSAAFAKNTRCNADSCLIDLHRKNQRWRLLAFRSDYPIAPQDLRPACANADIVVAPHRLPAWCTPRWLKIDRSTLSHTGGLTIHLAPPQITTTRHLRDDHPWISPPSP